MYLDIGGMFVMVKNQRTQRISQVTIYDKDNIYFYIYIKDQIKYTHPEPLDARGK